MRRQRKKMYKPPPDDMHIRRTHFTTPIAEWYALLYPGCKLRMQNINNPEWMVIAGKATKRDNFGMGPVEIEPYQLTIVSVKTGETIAISRYDRDTQWFTDHVCENIRQVRKYYSDLWEIVN